VHVDSEGPIGNLLHLAIFVAGAAFLGVVALAVIERLSEGDSPPRVGRRHVLAALAALVVIIGIEIAFHLLGGH
jgi:hypothetical protein